MEHEFEIPETMPLAEREQYYIRELQRQIHYAYENSPAMKAKLDKAGIRPSDIHSLKDVERIPVTKKDELIDLRRTNPPWGGLLAVPQDELQRIYVSPGPIYEPKLTLTDAMRKTLRALGFLEGDLVVNAWSYHMVPGGHMWDEGLRDIGCTVIPMGVGNTEIQVKVLHDLPVTGYVGPAGFLMKIITTAEAMGYDPRHDFYLRVAFAGAEPGAEEMRAIFNDKYGIMALDSYGTGDIGAIGYLCKERKGLHIVEEVLVEIVDPETGKQLGPGKLGEVVVTPLFEKNYPLIRFGTGDISAYIDEICTCGRTSFMLKPIRGRIGDSVRTRGMLIYSRQVGEVASKFREFSKVQAVVRRPQFRDELIVKVELADESVDREKLVKDFAETFSDICRVKIDRFEFVERGVIPEGAKFIVDERVI